MRVALIGPPQSGKSTLFAAIAEAGGSHVDIHRPDQAHLAVVKVPDERLTWLAERHRPKKTTPAELEFLDVPGFDLADDAARARAKAHWPALRSCDMLVAVLREFPQPAVPMYRGRIDPAADAEELLAEMLFADLDQVTTRIDKLEAALRKPTAQRDQQQHELDLMRRLAEALEADRPIAQAVRSEAEDKLLRSFAFLSLKPVLAVLNCSEDAMGQPAPPAGAPDGETSLGGESSAGSLPCLRLSAKIEEELARLAPAERGEFLADLGLKAPARDRLIRACYRRMGVVSFFTTDGDECRAWTVPAGTDALTAAGQIHTDMARGFIRAETIGFEDLLACGGDAKAARAAGKVRLEGKSYAVRDGDVIHFRFNV